MDALEYGVAQLRSGRAISLDLVRELHARLMTGARGAHASPGEFRTLQNWIGFAGSTIATATFVPPAPTRLESALRDWESFTGSRRDDVPVLAACALLHAQFETIHPFADGNGRIGRLLVTLFLIQRARLPLPLLYRSAFVARKLMDIFDRPAPEE